MRKILLILTALGVAAMADLSRSVAGVVTDSAKQLMWQDNYSDNDGNVKSANWEDAIDYCENLALAGYSDWRLPNIRELNSIVDLSRANPTVDPVFRYTESVYWSSTTRADGLGLAWSVNFGSGVRGNYYKAHTGYVRCVRSGQ